jgi:hypothetical protein
MRTRHPTNTRPNGRPCLARAAVAGGNPQYAPLSLPEPWRYAARQDPVEGAISSRTYTVQTARFNSAATLAAGRASATGTLISGFGQALNTGATMARGR